MRFLAVAIAACACGPAAGGGTMPSEHGHPTQPAPLITWTQRTDGGGALEHATLHDGGLRDTLFVAASHDGTVAAAMLDSEKPGVVAVMRQHGTAWHVERIAGNLLLATSPLVGHTTDDDHLAIEDLAGSAHYLASTHVTAADAGLAPDGSRCCGWWESTLWRTALDHPDHGLLRATTAPLGTWSVLDYHVPDRAERRWRVVLRESTGPAAIVDAVVAPAGDRAFIQVTDGKGVAALVAYRTDTGTELWRVATSATMRFKGALVIDDGGTQLATIVRDPSACEVCERAELYDAATGKLVRAVALRDGSILSRFGERGAEKTLGISQHDLWFRHVARGGGPESLKVAACTYQRWSLDDGRAASVHDLAGELTECTTPLRLVPIRAGVLGIQAVDAEHAELTRFQRAP